MTPRRRLPRLHSCSGGTDSSSFRSCCSIRPLATASSGGKSLPRPIITDPDPRHHGLCGLFKRKEKAMKLTTIALALAFTLPARFALAQAPMNLPGTEYRTTGVTVGQPGTELPTTGVTVGQTGHIATRPMNISGNTLGPIAVAAVPSGSTLTPIAVAAHPSGSTLTPSALMPGRTTGVTVGPSGPIATIPRNISGNTLLPIAQDPSGSTLTPSALARGG